MPLAPTLERLTAYRLPPTQRRLIPGSYASYHLVGIKMQWPGFDGVVVFSDDLELV